jgi:TldD protein
LDKWKSGDFNYGNDIESGCGYEGSLGAVGYDDEKE